MVNMMSEMILHRLNCEKAELHRVQALSLKSVTWGVLFHHCVTLIAFSLGA